MTKQTKNILIWATIIVGAIFLYKKYATGQDDESESEKPNKPEFDESGMIPLNITPVAPAPVPYNAPQSAQYSAPVAVAPLPGTPLTNTGYQLPQDEQARRTAIALEKLKQRIPGTAVPGGFGRKFINRNK